MHRIFRIIHSGSHMDQHPVIARSNVIKYNRVPALFWPVMDVGGKQFAVRTEGSMDTQGVWDKDVVSTSV